MQTGFICLDHQGNLYEGRLQTDISPDNNPILKEGDIYEISEFLVLPNFREHKFTPHPYFIQFTKRTTTTKLEDPNLNIPVHNFSPRNYNHLLHLATNNTYLPDVVGQIRLMQDLKPQNPESNSKLIIGLLLNRSTMVKLVFWDNQAADLRSL